MKKVVIIGSLVLSLLIVVGAVIAAQTQKKSETADPTTQQKQSAEQRTVTKAELAKATGKDGNTCYVAVDNTVFEIKDFSLWQNGEHKPSNGEAYCGADMTAAIDKSPHGRRMLDMLIKVGPLES